MRNLMEAVRDYRDALMTSFDVEEDHAETLLRDAIDTYSVWNAILEQVRDDLEWEDKEEKRRYEAFAAQKEDAYYEKLRRRRYE